MATTTTGGRMASSHKSITVLRCKVAMVGDAHVGKSAVKEMFHSGGQHYPKNYVMVRTQDLLARLRVPALFLLQYAYVMHPVCCTLALGLRLAYAPPT